MHYLRAGDGPPAVMIHSSPANAWFLLEEIERLARDYTVFAPDTPGFGLSQPLPLAEMQVADLADALAETLAAMRMPVCPMFGSHTGAAIALEFGARHPERISGLVLDGVPAFTTEECDRLFGDYFRDLPATDLGGQYAEVWTRFRDQSIWFPWSERHPENLNPYDLGAPESTHLWSSMYFDAADTYKPAYKAASHYGPGAIRAAEALQLPAIFTATDSDMLFPHLQRLPPMKAGQEIRHIGVSYVAKRELIAEGFARFGGASAAPADRDAITSVDGVGRQFVDGQGCGQIHLRYAGDRSAPPLLLFHDAPGSSGQWEALIEALGAAWFVIAPDLPGCGESDPFESTPPAITDYVAQSVALLDRLGITAAHVYGVGFGASVAVEFARRAPERVSGLALRGLLLPEPDERATLSAHFAPPIEIERDGGHWYRTWLMLRDSLVWWPWFDRRRAALRRAPVDFEAKRLHAWTVDVMRRRSSYGHLIQAALAHDARAALAGVIAPIVRLTDPATPLYAHDDRFAACRPGAPTWAVDPNSRAHAKALSRYFLGDDS